MINTLPSEIILKISGYLEFRQKLNLAKTCRILYNLISSAGLYEKLNLCVGPKKAEKIIKKFEQNEFDGTQVKHLIVPMTDISEPLRSQLSVIFPNVNTVQWGRDDQSILRDWNNPGDLTPPLSRWISTILTYNINGDWPKILYTLKFNVFPHLTELHLSHLYNEYERREGLDPLYFIPMIKNAPSLTKLFLEDCDINLIFLEEVHSSCRYLKTLVLNFVVIVIDTIPENIKPADGVLNLEIINTANFDRNGLLLEYIVKKYTGLRSFLFNLNEQDYKLRVKLETYFKDYFDAFDSDDEGDDEEEPDNIVSRLKEDFYLGNLVLSSSGANFFSRLPKTIQTLKMDIRSLNGLIGILDNAHMNITELDFCDTRYYQNVLKSANQLRHFESMTSLKKLKIPVSVGVQRYQENVISSSITHLEIMCPNGPVYIQWVLDMFPSLERLCIKDSACDVGRFAGDSNIHLWIHPTLNSLCLIKCAINSRVINYIKALAILLESQGRVFDIDLSGCKLDSFNMSLSSGKASTESYNPFTVQTSTEKMIHANWGETISLEKTDSRKLEYTASIRGFNESTAHNI